MGRLKGNPNCTDCGLFRSALNVCMMGQGPVPCDVMIIGDYPSTAEDEDGKPFSGRLSQSVLNQLGLKESEVYVTNSVKCRTPHGRTPGAKEIRACKQYLEAEIAAVKPKYVLLLGATSLKAALNKGRITENHGRIDEKNGVKYLATFSPGMAFRDPKRGDSLNTDLERFKQLINGELEELPPLNWTEIRSFDDFNDCVEDIRSARAVSFDLETTGLDRYEEGGAIRCLGIGTSNHKQWVLPLENRGGKFRGKRKVQVQMLKILAKAMKGKKVVTHNGKFDNLWLRQIYGLRFPTTFDTMLASHLLNENRPHGLKYLSRTILGAPDYDIEVEEKQGNTSPKVLYEYCAYDVYYTLGLYNVFRKQLLADEGQTLAKIFNRLVMPASAAFENIEERGVFLNLNQFATVESVLRERINGVLAKLREFLPEDKKDLNWNSTQQVGRFLFEDLKLKPLEKTKTGAPSTAEPVLKQMRFEHPVLDLLLEYRAIQKQISSFINGWKRRIKGERLHPSFKLHGTVTGRLSCTDPNLQQVPRDSTIRSLISAPPGWTFVQADYSQIELRVAAMLSGDTAMKMAFQTHQDIHTLTARNAVGRQDITKEEREKAKAENFGFLYGMGVPKFLEYARDNYGITLSKAEADKRRRRFFEIYSGLVPWHKRQRRIVNRLGQVRTPLGRIRRLPEVDSPDGGLRAEAERQAINSPVQSFASDIALMSLVELDRKMPMEKIRIVGSVHDALLFEVRNDYLEEALPILKKTMESPALLKEFRIRIPVPLVVDVEVGDWGVGKEWKP